MEKTFSSPKNSNVVSDAEWKELLAKLKKATFTSGVGANKERLEELQKIFSLTYALCDRPKSAVYTEYFERHYKHVFEELAKLNYGSDARKLKAYIHQIWGYAIHMSNTMRGILFFAGIKSFDDFELISKMYEIYGASLLLDESLDFLTGEIEFLLPDNEFNDENPNLNSVEI